MAKRIKIGDILQILTSEGVAYAQVTHKHQQYGFLIRVFPGFYPKTPKNFDEVVNQELQFSAFFPVQQVVNAGLLTIVDNNSIAEKAKEFPMFRARNGGVGGSIWFWDGDTSIRIEDRPLTDEENKYPIKGIISAPLLVERIENGYRAETHEPW